MKTFLRNVATVCCQFKVLGKLSLGMLGVRCRRAIEECPGLKRLLGGSFKIKMSQSSALAIGGDRVSGTAVRNQNGIINH